MQSALVALAVLTASQHGLNTNHFLATINCESGWNTHAIGDAGQSFGLAQIYRPAHEEVSIDEAEDPTFALNWMADEWSGDNAHLWSCWKDYQKKYGSGDWPQ